MVGDVGPLMDGCVPGLLAQVSSSGVVHDERKHTAVADQDAELLVDVIRKELSKNGGPHIDVAIAQQLSQAPEKGGEPQKSAGIA